MAQPTMKVQLNIPIVIDRIKKQCAKGTEVLANEMLEDSNFYARHDSGEMIESSVRSSEPEKGRLVWDKPYAKRVFYVGKPSKDKNPNARLQWTRVAFNANKKKYMQMLEKIFGKGVKVEPR